MSETNSNLGKEKPPAILNYTFDKPNSLGVSFHKAFDATTGKVWFGSTESKWDLEQQVKAAGSTLVED